MAQFAVVALLVLCSHPICPVVAAGAIAPRPALAFPPPVVAPPRLGQVPPTGAVAVGLPEVQARSVQDVLGQQGSPPRRVGLIFQWCSPGAALHRGPPGSGSSGWRLLQPSSLCPVIAPILPVTLPECLSSNGTATRGNSAEPQPCGMAGSCGEGPAERCTWKEQGAVCTSSGGSPSWPPLRAALVLAAPLDPLLGAALSLKGAAHSPICGAKTATGSGAGEGAELPYFGFWFAEGFEVLDPPMPAGLDAVAAAPDAWVVQRVWRELQGSGAHRQLVTRVSVERRAAASSAGGRGAGWVALVEALPSGVYADKFELRRMAHHGAASLASVFGSVDIERPAPECSQSLVVAYAQLAESLGGGWEATWVLPLHSRYPAVLGPEGDRPKLRGSRAHTHVQIGPPLCVLWSEQPCRSSEENLRMHSGWQHAVWREGLQDAIVRWNVPNGRGKHARIVKVGTMSMCFLGTICLLSVVMVKERA